MSQAAGEGVLRDHLARFGVTVELNTELVTLEQDEEGVTAHLKTTKGGFEKMEEFRAAWVIGTDGGKGESSNCISTSIPTRLFIIQGSLGNCWAFHLLGKHYTRKNLSLAMWKSKALIARYTKIMINCCC